MEVLHTLCNECETIKGTSNHWISVVKYPDKIVLFRDSEDITIDDGGKKEDYCGASCFMKVASRFIQNGNASNTA